MAILNENYIILEKQEKKSKYFDCDECRGHILNKDCFEAMQDLYENGVKVDAIICDLPQGITQNDWDKELNLDTMWRMISRIRKDETTPIIFFSNQPYTTKLISSNLKMFKYCKYWKKDRPSGFLNAKKQPLRDIEDIVVFYEKQCTYNPQMWEGKPLHGMGQKFKDNNFNNNNYGNFDLSKNPSANRVGCTKKYPRQLMEYNRPHPPIHPTQKPIELLEDLIKTYTNEDDIVLDFTAGVCSTAVACQNTYRKFICIEIREDYFRIGIDRIDKNSEVKKM